MKANFSSAGIVGLLYNYQIIIEQQIILSQSEHSKLKRTVMISWIKENIGLKNVLILTLVVLVIVGFLFAPKWYKMVIGSQYEGVAQARVTNITERTTTFQHYNGTSTKTVGYDISYVYEVKNEKFTNTEFIEADYDTKQIFDQFKAEITCMIEIKYSNKKPSESIISKINLKKQL